MMRLQSYNREPKIIQDCCNVASYVSHYNYEEPEYTQVTTAHHAFKKLQRICHTAMTDIKLSFIFIKHLIIIPFLQ